MLGRKILFWLASLCTAASGMFGWLKHPTFEFIASWSIGVVGAAVACAIMVTIISNRRN